MRFTLGIRGHDLPGAPFDTVDSFIESYRQFDLDTLQLVYKKAFRDFRMDPHFLLELAQKLKDNHIGVAMIGAYFNMIHPDDQKRLDGIEYFKWCMETAPVFHCALTGSETGSANGDKWTYNAYNHTQDAFIRVAETVKELKRYGNIFRVRPVIEGAYAHTVYAPEVLRRLTDLTGLEDVTVDIYNYLNMENYTQSKEIFERCLELLKGKIRIFHLKDFRVEGGKLVQCGIGDGILDWNYFLKRITEEAPDAALILEGITGKDIGSSIEFVRRFEHESEN